MKSKARIANHPIHPMLILIPAGAFLVVLFCDLLYLATGAGIWWDATRPVLVIGVLGALVSAVPGLIDLVTIVPRQAATRLGIAPMPETEPRHREAAD